MSRTTHFLLCTLAVVMFVPSSMYAQTPPPECERLGFLPFIITTSVDRPVFVFATDLDGDGDIDVLSASKNDDKIAWYENIDGLGTFGPQQIITTNADGAQSVFAADVDGDGDTDVLSASFFDSKIAWYENTDGLGTFGSQQVIITGDGGGGITSVFAIDIDGDSDIDVLSATQSDRIAWHENIDGLGTFGSLKIITTNADGAQYVFATDLNGDGDYDVLSASAFDDKIAWYENIDGLGTFGPQQIITTNADGTQSVFAADVDGDGDTDVLSASFFDSKIAWYENTDGLGTFGPQRIITTNADGALSVFAADLDGDKDYDVLSASGRDDKITWYENTDGLGAFGPQQVIATNATGVASVFAIDLDGDGDTDVLSASQGDKIEWYMNESDCNGNGVNDGCDIAGGNSADCNNNNIPDECDITLIVSTDCNNNNIPDECDIHDGKSADCNLNNIPDECEPDCNINGIADECEDDTDSDGLIDECDTCPESNKNETLVINGCDTNIANILFDDGCTMADVIAECQGAIQKRGIGKNVSCAADLANKWLRNRLITGREYSQIIMCSTRANNLNRNTLSILQPQQP